MVTSPYTPASHLVANSNLTVPQLVSQFQEFTNSLRYVSTAPELVFERLVANLSEAFNATITLERQEHSRTLQTCQLANDRLTAELVKLKENVKANVKEKVPAPVALKAVVLKKNPIIGAFHTKELRSWKQVRAKTSKVVTFTHAYSVIPSLLLGLTAVDVGNGANVRVKAYTSTIQPDRFQVNLDSWEETTLYGAGCAWLEIEADDTDFQFGSYHTIEDHPWTRPQIHNTRKITFKRAFAAAPHVVVWLSCIDLSSGTNWRIKTFATDVSAMGFTIHIDTWADSVLYTAVASWLAYPVDRAGVTSGSFTTLDQRSWAQPQLYNSGHEAFKSGVFEKPPKMFLALNSLDMGCGRNMRLSVEADNISLAGMTWHLNSWEDSVLYSAGASYIALR